MTESDALIAAIIANPADDAARLVFADCLEDREANDAPCPNSDCHDGKVMRGNNGNPYLATCNECDGAGVVSNGMADWAKFVRVQVELANYNDCHHPEQLEIPPWCRGCHVRASLRDQERKLWSAVRGRFAGDWWHAVTGGSAFVLGEASIGIPLLIVRRGLPAEVRAPLAALVGGGCERCYGRGFTTRPSGTGDSDCPACHGTGRTTGIGPRLAQAWPVEWVRAVDAIHEDRRFPGGHRINREQFPRELWLSLISRAALSFKGIVPSDANAITDTREGLEELLSRALIAWARKEQT